jgi:hypothetical protein
MLVAVVLASLAGFGRDRQLQKLQKTTGSFAVGLMMAVIAGVTSAGLWLAFIYCSGPIQSRVCIVEKDTKIELTVESKAEAWQKKLVEKFSVDQKGVLTLRDSVTAEPAPSDPAKIEETAKKIAKALSGKYLVDSDGSIRLPTNTPKWKKDMVPINVAGLTAKDAADKIARTLELPQSADKPNVQIKTPNVLAVFPVWAAGAFSGAMLNILYPAFLMTRKKSWGVLLINWKEFGLAAIIGLQMLLALTLPGKGILMIGALGAAIGTGIQQAMQMVGGQGTGFISGEWKGVRGKPRLQMYGAIALLILASFVMAYSNTIKE